MASRESLAINRRIGEWNAIGLMIAQSKKQKARPPAVRIHYAPHAGNHTVRSAGYNHRREKPIAAKP